MATQRTIEVYGTSLVSAPKLRSNHEAVSRILTAAKVPFVFKDCAYDEAAKAVFKRKNGGSNEMPLILSGGERVGSVEELQEAAEFGEIPQFLKLNEPVVNNDDSLLASLSESDAAALAAELDQPSIKATTAADASQTAAKAAAAEGTGALEKPVEPVPTPSTGGSAPLPPAEPTPAAAAASKVPAAVEEEEEEVPVNVGALGGLVPKDEVALKQEAREKEADATDAASVPTVPSGEKLAEAVQDNPEPAVVASSAV